MDDELKRLDLATTEARTLASDAIEALEAPQAALRSAVVAYVRAVAQRTVDDSRKASVTAMGQLSDGEVAELRAWTEEQVELAATNVEGDIEACDFWIPQSTGLSPNDVTSFGAALMPRPKDSPSGIPQSLVFLFEDALRPLRRGLAAVGFAEIWVDADLATERKLLRAWLAYRDAAIDCLSRWADVDEKYLASSARFQELRWESAGSVDIAELRKAQGRESDPETSSASEAATDTATEPEPEAIEPNDEPVTVPADTTTDLPLPDATATSTP